MTFHYFCIGVGKQELVGQFCDDRWIMNGVSTIGMDNAIKIVEIDGKRVKLQIWDTARQTVGALTLAFCREVMGILLVYDVTDEQSFLNIRNWMRYIKKHVQIDIQKLLIGNITRSHYHDHEDRKISQERGQELANEYGDKFFETSVKDDVKVREAFIQIATDILNAKNNPENRMSMDATRPKLGCPCIIL